MERIFVHYSSPSWAYKDGVIQVPPDARDCDAWLLNWEPDSGAFFDDLLVIELPIKELNTFLAKDEWVDG